MPHIEERSALHAGRRRLASGARLSYSRAMSLVSDRDREAATVALRSHYASGRLSLSELNERLQVALSARRGRDLAAALHELPQAWRDRSELHRRGTRMVRRAFFLAKVVTGWAMVNLFLLVSFVAVAALHGLSLLEASLLPVAWLVTTLLAFRIARRQRLASSAGHDGHRHVVVLAPESRSERAASTCSTAGPIGFAARPQLRHVRESRVHPLRLAPPT